MFNLGCDNTSSSRSYAANLSDSPFSKSTAGSVSGKKGNFTILLASFTIDDRIAHAQMLQQRAKRALNTEDVWFTSGRNRIDVNYGYFKTQKQAIGQKKRVKKIYGSLGVGPYQFYYIKEIPKPDPPAPTEWNILNNRCAYTLQVGTYYNVPELNYFGRKADAVQAVEAYRENNDPAYYYHGEHESYVLIGCIGAAPSGPVLQVLQKKYPFDYENGIKVNTGSRFHSAAESSFNRSGKIVKTPKLSRLVAVEQLTGNSSSESR